MEKDLIFQIIEYIERHSFEFEEPEPINNEKRRPGRPVKVKQPANSMQQPPPPPPKPTTRVTMRVNAQCLNC